MPVIRLVVPLAALLALGCSSNDDTTATSSGGPKTSVTQSIGPEGGTIELDGAKVTFPAGALGTATSITIAATDEAPPSGFTALSRIYKCEPTGLTFNPKVIMAMTFNGDGKTPTMFWSSGADPTFQNVGGMVSASVLTASVGHFSRGFVGHQP